MCKISISHSRKMNLNIAPLCQSYFLQSQSRYFCFWIEVSYVLLSDHWLDCCHGNICINCNVSPCSQCCCGLLCCSGRVASKSKCRFSNQKIIPRVDNETSQKIYSTTRGVTYGVVQVINSAIANITNANIPPNDGSLYYNQSGPLMPLLCNPLNFDLCDCQYTPGEVSFHNASQGHFDILFLSGSFLLSEVGGQRSRTGGLSVSLSGPDGRVLGGCVAGLLIAASPVQVIVGSFVVNGHKGSKAIHQTQPVSATSNLIPGSGAIGPSSPQSRGTFSESSGGPGSPLNQSTGALNNNNFQGMSSMPCK